MSYIGSQPTTAAFPFDQFSGDGTTTAFTLTYAPASTTSIVVAISGVVQNPNLYSVVGTTLTFSPAPPSGTSNIAVLYLGLPVITGSSPGNTAFLSATDLTATASQTVFASAGSYTPGFVQVYRNGARLGNADFTATNGTTITLANAATAGDLVTIEYYTLTSLTNALPLTGGTVTGSTTFNSAVTINGAAVSGFTGMKNRIINGNMVVDQRNAGAAVTISNATSVYTLDRWRFYENTDGVITAQQSSTAPAGFTNSLLVTVTTADTSIGSTQLAVVEQNIEGFNSADLMFGSASASTVTLSFWVRSNLTGTFGGALRNSGDTRSYPFSYTINLANTFEFKTVTVAGDTSGTWLTTNGIGLAVTFGLAVGSTYLGAASAWASANYQSATGQSNLLATIGNTFYITGVQLERGSNATSFEFIDYGRQLIQCQRYYYKNAPTSVANSGLGVGFSINSTTAQIFVTYPAQMRATPTTSTTNTIISDNVSYDLNVSGIADIQSSLTSAYIGVTHSATATTHRPCLLRSKATGVIGFVDFTAEL